jgi:hypothetical protein
MGCVVVTGAIACYWSGEIAARMCFALMFGAVAGLGLGLLAARRMRS